jgi:hypothetical protein
VSIFQCGIVILYIWGEHNETRVMPSLWNLKRFELEERHVKICTTSRITPLMMMMMMMMVIIIIAA